MFLRDKIVHILKGESKALTAQELLTALRQAGYPASRRGIYSALDQLGDEGIISLQENGYNLRLSWILSTLSHFEELYTNQVQYLMNSEIHDLHVRKRKSYQFRTLIDLLPFETHLTSSLLALSHSRVFYNWMPHPWFVFAGEKMERQFQDAIRRLRVTVLRVVGGNSALDRVPMSFWNRIPGQTSFGRSLDERIGRTHLMVIDDFIVTIKFDDKLSCAIDSIFSSSSKPQGLNKAAIGRFVSMPSKIKLTVAVNRTKANRYRSLFEQFFLPT